ncbi:MAG: MFS transporter, partial [Rhodospirillaceae bacterium]|nr:MFS transporter [Rhodospirillaceae bacterium]
WLIAALGWQASFYAVAVASLVCVVVFWRMPSTAKRTHAQPLGNPVLLYLRLLVTRPFMAFTMGHAFGIGALLTFIFAAPYMLTTLLGRDVATFAWMQVFLVGSFIIAVNLGPRCVERLGAETTIIAGGLMQLAGGLAFLGLVLVDDTPSTAALTVSMIPVNMGLGLRAGPTFTRAMDSAKAPDGSTGALMIFLIALVISAGTSAVAPFLSLGPWTLGVAVAVQTVLSMIALMIGLNSTAAKTAAQSA